MNERGGLLLSRPVHGPTISIHDPRGRLGYGGFRVYKAKDLHRGPLTHGRMYLNQDARLPISEKNLADLDEWAYYGGLANGGLGAPMPFIQGGANESGNWNETLGPNAASIADETGVTLTTTNKALWATVNMGMVGALRANFFTPGRMVRLIAFVKSTSGVA